MNRFFASLVMVLLLLGFGVTDNALGQIGADTSKGSVGVEVLDSSGAVIQGASVTLKGPMGERKTKTDVRGQAVFFNLVPGTYAVKVEHPGFRAFEATSILVRAAERSIVQSRLEPGAITETVQVTETAATVDTTSTTADANLTAETIANLPVTRNISGLVSMAPGVADGGGTGRANPSISGSSGLENVYIIDGINTTDSGYGSFGVWSNAYGSMGTGVNFDFVKEVQVKTGGFEAQYGQALGGVVNVVTHSGTNNLHGAVYTYLQPGGAQAEFKQPNDYPRVSDPLTETVGRNAYDVGFNIGGPIVKNKAFWYGAFNPSWSERLRQGPKGFGSRNAGPQPFKTRNYNWVGKLTYDLTDNHHLEGTAFGDPSKDPMGSHRSLVRNDVDNRSENTYGTRNWAVKYNGLWTSSTLFNASFSWNHTEFTETPEKELFLIRNYAKPTATSAYTLEGGLGFIENNESNNKQLSLMLTKNLTLGGGHQFDLGYSYNVIDYAAIRRYTGPQWPLFAWKGIDPKDVGKIVHGGYFYFYPERVIGGTTYKNVYRQVRGNFGDPAVGTDARYNSAFLQDAWQLNKYLTIKAGVRWEQQWISGNVSRYNFGNNWAPRIGVIYDPFGTRKTKLYASWGRFYEKVPQDPAVRAMSTESSYYLQYSFGVPPTAANMVPVSSFSPYATEPTIIYGGTKSQYQEEMVAGFEREVQGGWVLGARFIHRNLKRIIEDISGVTVEQANAGANQQFVIANPSVNMDIYHNAVPCNSGPNCDLETGYTVDSGELGPDGKPDGFPDPRRVYKALELTAEKRFANKWSFFGNYRLAKLFGNYEGLFRNDNGQSDPNITSLFDFANSPGIGDQFKVGVLPTDRRHIANLYGSYQLTKQFTIGLGWKVQSGVPLSKLLSHPAYGNAGEVPVGGRGSAGRSPTQNYWDMKLDYMVPIKEARKLRFAADMFNLFNRKTATDIDQNFELSGAVPNKDYLKPLAYARPFYARFSVRFEF